jgi:xylulokinase
MSTLGIDLGTGSVKVSVVTDELTISQQAEAPYPVHSPHPGWAESHPEQWLRAVEDCISEIAELDPAGDFTSVGLCGQMHGIVLVDEQLTPLRPAILWADTRSAEQARAMQQDLGSEHLARLGSGAVPGFAATSVAWVRENEPDVFARTRYVLQPKDWLRVTLGGGLATDPSDASGTLLADVASGRWDQTAIDWAGIDREQLPQIFPSGDVRGEIRVGSRSLPITVGAADTAAVLLSSGIAHDQGFVSVGTGAQVVHQLIHPDLDTSLRTHTFATAGEPGSGWYRIGAVQNAGLALEVALRLLKADISEAHSALDAGIRRDDPIFIPYLAGERTPFMNPDLRGAWSGIGLNTDREALLRSVLVGLAQAVALAVEAVFDDGGDTALLLLGGGTRDERFRQLLADAMNRELRPTVSPAQGVVGAAQLAMGRAATPAAVRPSVYPNSSQATILAELRHAMVNEVLSVLP